VIEEFLSSPVLPPVGIALLVTIEADEEVQMVGITFRCHG